MQLGASEQTRDKVWEKTSHSGLIRYAATGGYYARFKARGKLVWKSLETDVLTVAVLRLGDLKKQELAKRSQGERITSGRMTLGDLSKEFLMRVNEGGNKPRTKAYYAEVVARIEKSWPDWSRMDAARVTAAQCQVWSGRIRSEFSASVYNHAVGILRKVFEIAVERGARYDNPARTLKRTTEKPKRLQLPEPADFVRLVHEIESGGSGWSRPCADLVRFLAFGGFRKSEAANITWGDVDLIRKQITVRGDPEHGTKNGEVRRVPIISDMNTLLVRLRASRPEESNAANVMEVRECQKALDRACKAIGIMRITHHDLRHLFATRCIEAAVDIPTVSRWLGHKDGGTLAMRTYGHLRDTHSASMAEKVRF